MYEIVFRFELADKIRTSDIEMQYNQTNDFLRMRIDTSYSSKLHSVFSTIKTTIVCTIVVIASLAISKDVQDLILNPLEKLMEKVNKMAADPFQIILYDE